MAEEFTKYDYNEFKEMSEFVFDKPHKFMVIDRDGKKFNEIKTINTKK